MVGFVQRSYLNFVYNLRVFLTKTITKNYFTHFIYPNQSLFALFCKLKEKKNFLFFCKYFSFKQPLRAVLAIIAFGNILQTKCAENCKARRDFAPSKFLELFSDGNHNEHLDEGGLSPPLSPVKVPG